MRHDDVCRRLNERRLQSKGSTLVFVIKNKVIPQTYSSIIITVTSDVLLASSLLEAVVEIEYFRTNIG